MSELNRRVGIIGLGTMGGAIARNLVERGWQVVGCDPNPERAAEAQAAGASVVADAKAVAAEASLILTSLPSAAAMHAVARDLAACTTPLLVAELSTLALDDKEQAQATLSAANHVLLDCPLSGTGAQAVTRDLVVYASGDEGAIARCEPVFLDFARQVNVVGPFGSGTKMKFVANLLVAIHNVASAEAMVLGMKAGLPPQQIVDLISAGAGTSRMFEMRAPLMVDQRYEPATMKIELWQKDMLVIDAFARQLGCPTPLFTASESLYRSALANGQGKQDTASVCSILEYMAGHERERSQTADPAATR